MPLHKLSRGGVKAIHSAVDTLFDNLKYRALGLGGKRLYVGFNRTTSIPGVFERAAHEEGHKPDLALLDSLVQVASNYIDGTASRCKAKVTSSIDGWLREHDTAKDVDPAEMRSKLQEHLTGVLDEITTHVATIVDSEASHAKNLSLLDGYIKINEARGIDDPLIYWACQHDSKHCVECVRLHLLEDGTPRVWRLSECIHGAYKRGGAAPSLDGLHPFCRCTPCTLLPGFGFTSAGGLTYVAPGHDEYGEQHGVQKSEKKLQKALIDLAALPEFQEWFKGSKMVDDAGKPKV